MQDLLHCGLTRPLERSSLFDHRVPLPAMRAEALKEP